MQQPSASDPAETFILKAAAALGVLGQNGATAPRILATLYDPETTPAKIQSVIALEPGLTVRVLRVANSSLYGLRQKIATIEHAVLVLGLDAIRSVAAAACFDRGLLRNAGKLATNVDALHAHSLATAVAAESLTSIHDKKRAPEAFVAGLLHDLGVMIRLQIYGSDVRALHGELLAADDTADPQTIASSFSHERCASVTLRAWGLPPTLVAAIEHHHAPDAAPILHRERAACVCIADYLSTAAGMSFDCDGTSPVLDDALLALAGVEKEQLDAIATTLPTRVAELQAALGAP